MDQRNQADGKNTKAAMAYGGGPKDSLTQLMRKNDRKPMNNAPKQQQVNLSTQQIIEIYKKVWNYQNNMTAFNKEERIIMLESDQENKRKGFFKRIFPCYDFLYYK